jgi:hypothetical protein
MKLTLVLALVVASVGGCAVVPVGPRAAYVAPRAVVVAPVVVVPRPYYRY